jgi:hypothetical protein
MKRNTEPLLNELLARWHRWASAAVRLDDSLLRDLDVLVSKLSPRRRVAIIALASNLARNASSGAAVWSSNRADASAVKQAKACLHAALLRDEARWFGREKVHLNERGNRVGQSNPMAEATDHDVDLCRELRAEGYSFSWLAEKFEVSKGTVFDWCSGRRRGQLPVRVKEVG